MSIKDELTGIEFPFERVMVFGPNTKLMFNKKTIDAQIDQLTDPAMKQAAKYRVIAILNGEYKSLTIRRAWLQLEGRDTHDDMTTVINRLYDCDTMARQYTFELIGRDMF